jgi:hypothetical protein
VTIFAALRHHLKVEQYILHEILGKKIKQLGSLVTKGGHMLATYFAPQKCPPLIVFCIFMIVLIGKSPVP